MIVVNRGTFLKMPIGTVYAKYSSPWSFSDLCIKWESSENDWIYTEILGWPEECNGSNDLFDKIDQYENQSRFDMEVTQRDGYFDDDQLFAVLDNEDIGKIIKVLQSVQR